MCCIRKVKVVGRARWTSELERCNSVSSNKKKKKSFFFLEDLLLKHVNQLNWTRNTITKLLMYLIPKNKTWGKRFTCSKRNTTFNTWDCQMHKIKTWKRQKKRERKYTLIYQKRMIGINSKKYIINLQSVISVMSKQAWNERQDRSWELWGPCN